MLHEERFERNPSKRFSAPHGSVHQLQTTLSNIFHRLPLLKAGHCTAESSSLYIKFTYNTLFLPEARCMCRQAAGQGCLLLKSRCLSLLRAVMHVEVTFFAIAVVQLHRCSRSANPEPEAIAQKRKVSAATAAVPSKFCSLVLSLCGICHFVLFLGPCMQCSL